MPPATLSLPTDADLLVLPSPAFDAPPPDVRHRDRIPDDVLRSMEGTWGMGRFAERRIRVLRLRDIWVAGDGLVFDRDGALYRETITQHGPAAVAAARDAVLAAIAAGATASDRDGGDRDGPVVLCKKPGLGNYGHWMMEMLPRARIVHDLLPELKARVLVGDAPEPLRGVMADSLALLGIDPARAVVAGTAPRRFAELLLVEGLTEHGVYMSPLVLDCAAALARGVVAGDARNLLVSRQTAGIRRLVDEDALALRAQETGWVPVEPARLSLPEQIALFKGADGIAGVMGAALTNIAFAPSGSRVTVFAPVGMPDTFFWFIATLRGLHYTEIRCAQTGPVRGNAPWDTDLILDPEDAAALFGASTLSEPAP